MGLLSEIWETHPGLALGPEELVKAGLETAAAGLEKATGDLPRWTVLDEGSRSWLVRDGRRAPFIRPMPHQEAAWLDPTGSKLLRWGRRTGKTRLALRAAIAGHGPVGEWTQGDGEFRRAWSGHKHRGILSGMDVVWIARDFKQANAVWFEEIRPKLKGRPGVVVNETDRWVHLEGHGTLWIRSADNIDSIRGIGDMLVGAIIDEAAYLDLERALKEVLLPALADNEGWVIAMSTPNAGSDHNPERPAGPSYFNLLCQEVIDGDRAGDWAHFHATARENPRITARAFAKLCAEYEPSSHSYQQEIEAKLLKGLHGLQFTEWRDDLHVVDLDINALDGWTWRAGLDWGFTSPGWFGLGAFGPKGREYLYAEVAFNGKPVAGENLPPFEVGRLIGMTLQTLPMPDRIVADSAMWATGDGRGGRVKSDAEEFQRGLDSVLKDQAPRLVRSVKHGEAGRTTRVKLFHQSLRYVEVDQEQPDGSTRKVVPPWGRPRFAVHSRCKTFIRSVPALPVSPANADDVDTNAFDHPFDGWSYVTVGRPMHPKERERARSPHRYSAVERVRTEQGQVPSVREPRWQRT